MDRITELLELTSRTFALGIRSLASELERTVAVAYLLLRVSDYFEDNPSMGVPEKVRYLAAWAEALRSETQPFAGPPDFDDSTPDASAARESTLILSAFRSLPPNDRAVLRKHVTESTEGMARWVQRGPDFGTEDDLDDYMFEVAGRVGLLLTDLFSLRSTPVRKRHAEMSRLGVQFGLGLQTVNVIRGMSSDPDRGWIFLPREFLPPGTDEPARLWATPSSPPALALVDRLVDKAERHLRHAREYVLGIPRRERGMRVFCLLPLIFAVRTVRKSRGNPAVYQREVKLTRPEVRSIARRTSMLAGSNTWVRRLI